MGVCVCISACVCVCMGLCVCVCAYLSVYVCEGMSVDAGRQPSTSEASLSRCTCCAQGYTTAVRTAMVQDRIWASHGRWISRGRGTYPMSVTLLTSHEPMSWLNAAAPSNMYLYANTHTTATKHPRYTGKRGSKRQAHIVVRKGFITWQQCTDTEVDGTAVGHGVRLCAWVWACVCVSKYVYVWVCVCV